MRLAVLCTDQGVRVPGDKGASHHLLAITNAFLRLGHDVLLIGVEGRGAPPAGLPCLLFPHPGRADGIERERRKLRLVDHIASAAADRLTDFAPDIVYERLSLFGTAGVRLASHVGAPHVTEVNALLAEEESTWRGLDLADDATRRELHVLQRTQLRVCVSAELAGRVESLAPGPPTIVVPNGVDAELFNDLPAPVAARTRFALPTHRHLVGFVGSVRPWHGLDVALHALDRLPPSVDLVIAGDGPTRSQLADIAAQLGVSDRVHWLGSLPHAEIPGVLAAIDIAIAPYPHLDTFVFSPLKLYEYLAAGVPVVASDIGQITSLLDHGNAGELVTPGDPAALAAGILRTLTQPRRARERAAVARLDIQRNHDWTSRAAAITDAAQRTGTHATSAPHR